MEAMRRITFTLITGLFSLTLVGCNNVAPSVDSVASQTAVIPSMLRCRTPKDQIASMRETRRSLAVQLPAVDAARAQAIREEIETLKREIDVVERELLDCQLETGEIEGKTAGAAGF
jgi:hypothetical protein